LVIVAALGYGGVMTTGEIIRKARIRWGISQAELAKHLGVSQGTVWNWEHDRARPRDASKVEIARALLIPLAKLVRP